MYKKIKTKHLFFVIRLLLAVVLASAVSFAGISSSYAEQPYVPLQVLTEKISQDGGPAYKLTLSYKDGYKLNLKAPESKRLTYILDDGETSFQAKSFRKEAEGATLSFKTDKSPNGTLTVYLCRPDRCQRVKTAVKWIN